jgi:Uma2 family endonuclease
MATVRSTGKSKGFDYPTSDGRPMAETDWHRDLMLDLIATLEARYVNQPMVYVSGNLLLFYEPGNRRRHISPDVFVVKGAAKQQRPNFLVWEEGKGPDVVIEVTSTSTRNEDLKKKYALYRDTLRVPEYFLFDPLAEYLTPPLQGYRLRKGQYEPIKPVKGRLPSKVLGLHLERNGRELRLYDSAANHWLPTPEEALQQAKAAHEAEARARREAQEEVARLQRELEKLRRQLGEGS